MCLDFGNCIFVERYYHSWHVGFYSAYAPPSCSLIQNFKEIYPYLYPGNAVSISLGSIIHYGVCAGIDPILCNEPQIIHRIPFKNDNNEPTTNRSGQKFLSMEGGVLMDKLSKFCDETIVTKLCIFFCNNNMSPNMCRSASWHKAYTALRQHDTDYYHPATNNCENFVNYCFSSQYYRSSIQGFYGVYVPLSYIFTFIVFLFAVYYFEIGFVESILLALLMYCAFFITSQPLFKLMANKIASRQINLVHKKLNNPNQKIRNFSRQSVTQTSLLIIEKEFRQQLKIDYNNCNWQDNLASLQDECLEIIYYYCQPFNFDSRQSYQSHEIKQNMVAKYILRYFHLESIHITGLSVTDFGDYTTRIFGCIKEFKILTLALVDVKLDWEQTFYLQYYVCRLIIWFVQFVSPKNVYVSRRKIKMLDNSIVPLAALSCLNVLVLIASYSPIFQISHFEKLRSILINYFDIVQHCVFNKDQQFEAVLVLDEVDGLKDEYIEGDLINNVFDIIADELRTFIELVDRTA